MEKKEVCMDGLTLIVGNLATVNTIVGNAADLPHVGYYDRASGWGWNGRVDEAADWIGKMDGAILCSGSKIHCRLASTCRTAWNEYLKVYEYVWGLHCRNFDIGKGPRCIRENILDACSYCNDNMMHVKMMLRNEIALKEVCAGSQEKGSYLHKAYTCGNFKIVVEFLKAGGPQIANVQGHFFPLKNCNVLDCAVYNCVCAEPISFEERFNEFIQVLQWCEKMGEEVLELVLFSEADYPETDSQRRLDHSSLIEAAIGNASRVVAALLACGGGAFAQRLARKCTLWDEKNAMYEACSRGNVASLQSLLAAGVAGKWVRELVLDVCHVRFRSCLVVAACAGSKHGESMQLEIVRALLDVAGKHNFLSELLMMTDNCDRTCFQRGLSEKCYLIADELLNASAAAEIQRKFVMHIDSSYNTCLVNVLRSASRDNNEHISIIKSIMSEAKKQGWQNELVLLDNSPNILTEAFEREDAAMVSYLLKEGKSNGWLRELMMRPASDPSGNTCLHVAVRSGIFGGKMTASFDEVLDLSEHDMIIFKNQAGNNCLQHLMDPYLPWDHVKPRLVKLLEAYGSKLTTILYDYKIHSRKINLLHLAVVRQFEDAAIFLLTLPYAKKLVLDEGVCYMALPQKKGMPSLLCQALENGWEDVCVKILEVAGRELLQGNGGNVSLEQAGEFVLHIAFSKKLYKLVAAMLKVAGAKHHLTLRDNMGLTCLFNALFKASEDDLLIIEEQINAVPSVDFKQLLLITSVGEQNCLHAAVMSGHVKIVKYVLKKAPELLMRVTETGKSALFLAVQLRHFDIVEYLLEQGGKPLVLLCNSENQSCLHTIASCTEHFESDTALTRRNRKRIISRLMDVGGNILIQKKKNGILQTCLHAAVGAGSLQVVEMFLHTSGKSELTTVQRWLLMEMDGNGRSCLHLAMESVFVEKIPEAQLQQETRNRAEVVRLLLDKGGTGLVMILDREGRSCLESLKRFLHQPNFVSQMQFTIIKEFIDLCGMQVLRQLLPEIDSILEEFKRVSSREITT